MGRHVQRVRRGGRDARITARRRQPFLGQRRCVVDVNKVMRDARMVRIFGEHRLQDRGRASIGGIGLIGLGLRSGEIQRVEDLGFVVGGVTRRQSLVRLGPGLLARAFGPVRPIAPVLGDGLEIIFLPLRFRARLPPFGHGRDGPFRLLGSGTRAGQRIGHQQRGDAPIRDPAGGILFQDIAKCLFPGGVPEGMQHRDPTGQLRLDLRATGIREGSLAKFPVVMAGVLVVRQRRADSQGQHHRRGRENARHDPILPGFGRVCPVGPPVCRGFN